MHILLNFFSPRRASGGNRILALGHFLALLAHKLGLVVLLLGSDLIRPDYEGAGAEVGDAE